MKKCFSCGTQLSPDAKFCLSCGQKQPEENSQSDMEMLQKELAPSIEVIEKIGQGGMADIYLGRQVSLDRKVVIKLLFSNLALDPKIQEKFLMESKVAANLKHTHIVDMIDQGEINGRPYFIMEYGMNGSLEDRLVKLRENRSKLPFRTACEYILNILDAIDFAHSKNVIAHRDVKPDNILFRENEVLFLSDFGIALRKGESVFQGEKIGSPPYMSPEQILGNANLDSRSDLYSVGILFFELLTSSHPYNKENVDWKDVRTKGKIPSLIHFFSKDELIELKKTSIDLGKIQKFIEKACAKNPNDRFQSARDMINSLKLRLRDQERNRLARSALVRNRGKIRKLVIIASVLFLFSGFTFYKFIYKVYCNACCVGGECENGTGTYRYEKGKEYTGDFKDKNAHGKGKITFPNGDWYEGDFFEGKVHGDGVLYQIQDEEDGKKNTVRFIGNFKDGNIEGTGTVKFKDGSVYDGVFKDGKPIDGDCTIKTMDGVFYNGKCKDMTPEGKGYMIYSDKTVYEGEFRKGERHGYGSHKKNGKLIFQGEWKDNQPFK